jgi:hypothetical protein
MRTLLLALAACSILVLSTGNSFAQTVGTSQQAILGVYAQIVVHDSSGNLVSYSETDHVKVVDPARFNEIINANINLFQKNVINVGGQNLEILQVNDSTVHDSPTIVSINLITLDTANGKQNIVIADHDGYPVVKGDDVTTYWTIIRTAS